MSYAYGASRQASTCGLLPVVSGHRWEASEDSGADNFFGVGGHAPGGVKYQRFDAVDGEVGGFDDLSDLSLSFALAGPE